MLLRDVLLPAPSVRLSAQSLHDIATTSPSQIERLLADHLISRGLGRPSLGEERSWRSSLPVLARDLHDAGLDGLEVLLEYQLPLSSKRTDAILAGRHRRTGAPHFVVVELKQWSSAAPWPDSADLLDVPGAPYRPVLHPSVQVGGYVQYLADFVAALAPDGGSGATIDGVAYLHNASRSSVGTLWQNPQAARSRVFTGDDRGAFLEYLRGEFSEEPGAEAADLLTGSRIAPSKQLLSVAAAEVRDREQFVLLDEQRVAFELVLRAVENARRNDTKEVVVVTGGPGSGKSVIALSLLGELSRQGRPVLHATGSRSFTQTLRRVAGKGSTRTQSLFRYFNSFMDADRNGLEVLISDEAHRIRGTSVNRYTAKAVRDRARPQVQELIDAARVPVFLLDEHQVVRPGELGTVADIKAAAALRGVPVRQVDLNAEFRAGGSEAYVTWVLRLLGLEAGGPLPWHDEPSFTVDVVDSPEELEARLRADLDTGLNARMTAGFCWTWSDPLPGGGLVSDVVIGDWKRPWNVKGDRTVGDAPPSALWASDPGGFGQVGCVYTAQGFEYASNGVIIGPDLVWRAGGFVSRRSENRDPEFRSAAKASDTEFDRLVRNIYKVLLTRGMAKTLIYSTDAETRAALRGLINPR